MKKFRRLFVAVLFMVGMATQVFAISSINNNFTMLDPGGGLTGGTNDVVFTWDGTKLTSVAASGQVPNATLSSATPFYAVPWQAHDVAIYGPGTYTVYADCAAGSPGCGLGTPITFTVASNQLGAHILFDWGGNNDIDVVDVWALNAAFGPSPMYPGPDGTLYAGSGRTGPGYGDSSWVWSFMSSDWDGDGINGAGMVDGPFTGFNANFNVNYVGTTNNNCTVLDSSGGMAGGFNDVAFIWNGTRKTSVAASGQVPNATLTTYSMEGFFETILLHDVAIYGPGTYTIYTNCSSGNPGCGTGTPITFTVGDGQLGVHFLYENAYYYTDLDVVNVWIPGSAFGPSALYPGPDGGTNPANKVWDWMSSDWNGDGINGSPMVEGPFLGFNFNVNVMGVPPSSDSSDEGCVNCADGDLCTTDTCVAGVCVHSPVVCDDGNICTIDSCDPATGACVTAPKCVDTSLCTTDTCNPTTGVCTFPAKCNDNNVCTTDTCNASSGACTFPPKCVDTNLCTTDTCNPTTGACTFLPKNCNDNNGCTNDSCTAATGACVNAPKVCADDNNVCTTDSCNPATANGCVYTPSCPILTTGNNFTMIDPAGGLTGGTNDVIFSWDGSKKTSVAASGQISNAVISSTCPFSAITWTAHDVAIYGPGTYTVYAGCAAGSPGCGTGTPITFTVAAGEIGAHLLFNWGPSSNIDVVNVWTPDAAFGPSPMCAGAGSCGTMPTCGSNPADKVWNWMSKDWNADGKNGYPMVDGPFMNFNANFNVMGVPNSVPADCNDNNACTDDISVDGICSWRDNCPAGSACNKTTGVCMEGTCYNNRNCDPALYCAKAEGHCGGVFQLNFLNYRSWEGPGSAIDSFNITIRVQDTDSTVHVIDKTMNGQVIAVNVGDTIDVRLAGNPTTGYEWKYVSTNSLPLKQTIFTLDQPILVGSGGTYDFIFVPGGDDGGGAGTCQMKPDPNTCPVYVVEPIHACGCDGVTYYDTCMAAAAGVNTAFDGNCIGCVPSDCNDGNACTLDTCNPSTGCVHTPIICNDGNPCTTDTCNSSTGCVHTPVVCNDSNVCTTDYCDSAGTGACVYAPKCADTNPCTVDTCDATTGACTYTPKDCNDNNVCTTDTCNTWTGACVHTPIVCNDNNTCTTDICDPVRGCVFTPVDCNPDPCSSIICGCIPTTGCVCTTNIDTGCDDFNACTVDTCILAVGCVHTPITCNDSNACTTDSCNPATGCVFTLLPVVGDGNPCTDDSCDPATGLPVYTNNTAPCDDGLFCTGTDTCSGGTCSVHSGDPCTSLCSTCNETVDFCEVVCTMTALIRGGGQSPNNVDLQIQTLFTVTNGYVVDSTASTITVSTGSTVIIDSRKGTGPTPTSGTWNGVPIPLGQPLVLEFPTAGTAGKLVLTNTGAPGGKDTDRITIYVQ